MQELRPYGVSDTLHQGMHPITLCIFVSARRPSTFQVRRSVKVLPHFPPLREFPETILESIHGSGYGLCICSSEVRGFCDHSVRFRAIKRERTFGVGGYAVM